MERLMEIDPYRKDPSTRQFNEKYIIQLRENYRSHKAILQFPSNKFYDGTIVAKAFQSKLSVFGILQINVAYYLRCVSVLENWT